ncbi:hypothetical protein SRHO_G00230350 [Serrasalmus rhombeus]
MLEGLPLLWAVALLEQEAPIWEKMESSRSILVTWSPVATECQEWQLGASQDYWPLLDQYPLNMASATRTDAQVSSEDVAEAQDSCLEVQFPHS